MPTMAKDKCPSCFQSITPGDFLCASCELILDPSKAPEKPSREGSVVRRLLEAPQRGVPAEIPDKKKDFRNKPDASAAATRKLDLGPELNGVPIVVASLSKKAHQLTELEAWLVSLIDGRSDALVLADKAGMRELELRVILHTLHEKLIIDFADDPLTDEILLAPVIEAELSQTFDEDADEPLDVAVSAPLAPPVIVPLVPPTIAPVLAPPPPPQLGASVDRRDARFVAPPAPPVLQPPPPPPASPPRARSPQRADPSTGPAYPGASGVVSPKGLFTVPRAPGEAPPPQPAAKPAPPEPQTDPRIRYSGQANRRVLDALKSVKRVDGSSASPTSRSEGEQSVADVLARDSLQIALRMEQSGRMDEAIRFLEKSIAQSPDAASLYNRLGIILMRERADYRRAEELIRKATEIAPTNNVYSSNLQQVISRLALRQR